jgi:hypothetical protein
MYHILIIFVNNSIKIEEFVLTENDNFLRCEKLNQVHVKNKTIEIIVLDLAS